MYSLIPGLVSFTLLSLYSQTLAADHNLIPRQATTCDPTQPAPTENSDGSLNTFTISVINPIIPGPKFMLGVAPRIFHPDYLGSNLFLSNTGESLFNIMYGTNLYTLSVTNHFCGFDNSTSSLEDEYEIYCGVDQDLQPAKTGVVGLTWTCPNPSGPPVYVVQATLPAGFPNPNPAPGNFQVPVGEFQEGTTLNWCHNQDECNISNSVIVNLVANFLPPVPTPTATTVTATITAIATVTETDTETVTATVTTAACQGICLPLLRPL